MPTDQQLIERLRKAHTDVSYAANPGMGSAYQGVSFLNAKPTVFIGDDHKHIPSVLAHELGHHTFGGTRLGRVMQNGALRVPLRLLAAPGSAIAGLLAARSDEPYAPYAAALVPALAHAPTLISEGAATHNAIKKLRAAGANAAQISKAKRTLGGAFGSYAANAAFSGALTAAPIALRRYWDKRRAAQEKTSNEQESPKGWNLFSPDVSEYPRIQRSLQGALAGGALGLVSDGLMLAGNPDILGKNKQERVTRALQAAVLSAMSGAGYGGSLGAYEATRFHNHKLPTLSLPTWAGQHFGEKDRAQDQKETGE